MRPSSSLLFFLSLCLCCASSLPGIGQSASVNSEVPSASDQVKSETRAALDLAEEKIMFRKMEEGLGMLKALTETALDQEDWGVACEALNLEGRAWTMQQQYPKAIAILDSSLKLGLAHLPQPHPHTAQSHNNLGFCLQATGQGEAGIEQVKNALALRKEIYEVKGPQVLQSYFILSVVLGREGYFEAERRYLDTVLQITAITFPNDPNELTQPYNNLGVWYSAQGDLLTAQSYYEKTLAILEEQDPRDPHQLAAAYNNMGNLLQRQGAFPEALAYLRQALELNEERQPASAARNWLNIGNCYMDLRDYPAAIQAYENSLDLEKVYFGPQHPPSARALIFQVRPLSLLGDWEGARKKLDRARQILAKAPPRFTVDRANLKAMEGEFQFRQGKVKKGRQSFQEGLALMESKLGRQHFRVFNVLLEWAALELKQGQPAMVLELVDSLDQRISGWPQRGARNRYAWPLQGKARFLAAQAQARDSSSGAVSLALEELVGALDLTDSIRIHLLDSKSQLQIAEQGMPMFELGLELASRRYAQTGEASHLETLFSIMERSKSFLLNQHLQGQGSGLLPDSLARRERELKSSLARYDRLLSQSEASDPKYALWDSLRFNLGKEYAAFETYLSQAHPSYYQLRFRTAPLGIGDLQAQLGAQEVLLSYFAGETHWYVLAIQSEQVQLEVLPHTAELQTQIQAWRQVLSQAPDPNASLELLVREFSQPATSIYNSLLAPVLEGKDITDLCIVPDGALRQLPLEVLLTSPVQAPNFTALPYLMRQMRVHYLNAARQYRASTSGHVSGKGMLALAPEAFANAGNLDEGKGSERPGLEPLPDLPFSAREVEQAVAIWGGRAVLGEEASEQLLKTNSGSYQIIHLATHARTADSLPESSGFYLHPGGDSEDGFLYGWELLSLPLQADLAVLSACNTGVGPVQRGEGVLSLARDFRLAGCPAVLMSLWNANDQAASQLMENFYGELARGEEKDAALRSARLAYLEQADALQAHPFYWSGFVLVGNDAAIRTAGGDGVVMWVLLLGLAGLLIGWVLKVRREFS